LLAIGYFNRVALENIWFHVVSLQEGRRHIGACQSFKRWSHILRKVSYLEIVQTNVSCLVLVQALSSSTTLWNIASNTTANSHRSHGHNRLQCKHIYAHWIPNTQRAFVIYLMHLSWVGDHITIGPI